MPAHPTFKSTADGVIPIDGGLLCSFVEEMEQTHRVNVLEVTRAVTTSAWLKSKDLHFGSYISGFAFGGIGNYTLNIEERGENFNILKITGTFYCVPSEVHNYCLPDHCT